MDSICFSFNQYFCRQIRPIGLLVITLYINAFNSSNLALILWIFPLRIVRPALFANIEEKSFSPKYAECLRIGTSLLSSLSLLPNKCTKEFVGVRLIPLIYSLVYSKIRHEAKTAYSENTIKSLKTCNITKTHAVHKYIIYNNNYKHIKKISVIKYLSS